MKIKHVFPLIILLGAVLLTFGLQLAVIYTPLLQPIFKTQPLTLPELAACVAVSSVTLVASEIEKLVCKLGVELRECTASQRPEAG